MTFADLLTIVGDDPVFESSLLIAGDVDPAYVQQQLSRWTRSERVHKLRKTLYALAAPWRKVAPHPWVLSNRLARGSYVSCESALSHYGLIPDAVNEVTAVSIGRPAAYENPFGRFRFRHVAPHLLWGYVAVPVATAQEAFVATPEKALIDLVHFAPGGDRPAFLDALRLQNLERLDLAALARSANKTGNPKIRRATAYIADSACDEASEFEEL